jgi:hypothetical protein
VLGGLVPFLGTVALSRALVGLSVPFGFGRPWFGAVAASTTYDWLQFGGDPQHSFDNTSETTITPSNVASLQLLFQTSLPGQTDATPAVLTGVQTSSGVTDLLLVELGWAIAKVVALDAHTGALVWSTALAPNASCTFPEGVPCYTPSSVAVDPGRQYVYGYAFDGRVHKLNVSDGSEVVAGGWPEIVTLKPSVEKTSTNLTIATAKSGVSYLYVSSAGEDDSGDYQGHVTTINLSDGSQHVFNTLCSNQVDVHFVLKPGMPDCQSTLAGIWGRGNILYEPHLGRIYFADGNAPFSPAQFNWGDSVIALNPDGSSKGGVPIDSYTPTDQATLNANDLDLGSQAVVLMPAPPNSTIPYLGIQAGKDATLRLLNLANLSGGGGPGLLGGELTTVRISPGGSPNPNLRAGAPTWVNSADQSSWVFENYGDAVSAVRLAAGNNGALSLQVMWKKGCSCVPSGEQTTVPLIANGVLYVASNADLEALDPATGNLLWQSTAIDVVHWGSPVVANGILYLVSKNGQVDAFSMPPGSATPTATSTATLTATATSTPTGTPTVMASSTPTATLTVTASPTKGRRFTPTPTVTRTVTATPTRTPRRPTATRTPTVSSADDRRSD